MQNHTHMIIFAAVKPFDDKKDTKIKSCNLLQTTKLLYERSVLLTE